MSDIEHYFRLRIADNSEMGAARLHFSKVLVRQNSANVTSGPTPRTRTAAFAFRRSLPESHDFKSHDFAPPFTVPVDFWPNSFLSSGMR